MSQPEWMKKFQEIGQKGEEEVTQVGNAGFVKTAAPKRASFKSNNDSNADVASEMQSSFASSSYATSTSGANSTGADDPAAMFRAAGTPQPLSGTFSSVDPPSSSSGDESSSEDSSDSSDGDDSSSNPANDDEEVGEGWVPNQEKVNRGSDDIDSQAAAEAGRQSFDQGESFITEEVFVDENGNLVDENGSVIQDENGNAVRMDESGEEEILDESGDEIPVDESGDEMPIDESGDEMPVDENGDEIQEEVDDESEDDIVPQQKQDLNRDGFGAMPGGNKMQGNSQIYDIEEQKEILGFGKTKHRSRMSWFIPILMFGIIVAAVLLVLFLVVYNEDRASNGNAYTMAPTPTNYLPLDPSTNSYDAVATTEFDDIQNDCSLTSSQPNIIDQCDCGNTVDIVADDVRVRWEDHVQNFIPSIFSNWNQPSSSCSAENQALLWLSSGINNGGEIDNLLRLQRYVLAIMYYQHEGTEWIRSANWLSERNACEWEGVECDNNGYVRILNLDQNQLIGQISSTATLFNAIEAYFVASNNLFGTIPNAFFSDNSLRSIDFSNNALTGGFPSSGISKDSKISRINFASNKLNGSIPRQIRRIAGLEILNIESNAFSGALPKQLFTLNLTELSIGGNNFNGTVPEDLPTVTTLTSLSLGPNTFTGDLPASLSQLDKLERLSIEGIPGLGGRLPDSYGLSLTDLVELRISNTNVEGGIPFQYSNMKRLETLKLNNNSIRGTIPSDLYRLKYLKSLSLHGNSLTGTIPSEMGSLTSIRELQFHTNSLSGTIPNEFGNLRKMRTLTFENNFMSGRVPNQVCALRDAELNKFVVDCPTRAGEFRVDGIICSIPDCCTECV